MAGMTTLPLIFLREIAVSKGVEVEALASFDEDLPHDLNTRSKFNDYFDPKF
jgi:hypothetical protein